MCLGSCLEASGDVLDPLFSLEAAGMSRSIDMIERLGKFE
jgi:hypothetical protein